MKFSLLREKFLRFIFPTGCRHCGASSVAPLCPACFSGLELIDPAGRCPRCFSDEIGGARRVCTTCQENPPASDWVASAFDYLGPAKSLVDQFSLHDEPYLAKTLAAFLYLEFEALGWDAPDFIVYVPETFLRTADRGYNPSYLLAQEFSRLVKKPVRSLFKKSSPTLPQRALVLKDRKQLSCENFLLQDSRSIEDKRFLLVDDLYVTGATAQAIATQLQAHHPKRIYVLTVCRG